MYGMEPYDLKTRRALAESWLCLLLELQQDKVAWLGEFSTSFWTGDEGTWQKEAHPQHNIVICTLTLQMLQKEEALYTHPVKHQNEAFLPNVYQLNN